MIPLYQARCGMNYYRGDGSYGKVSWPGGKLVPDSDSLTLSMPLGTVTVAVGDIDCLNYGVFGNIQVVHHDADAPSNIWIQVAGAGLARAIRRNQLPIRIEGNVAFAEAFSTASVWAAMAFIVVSLSLMAFGIYSNFHPAHRQHPIFPRPEMEAIVQKLHRTKFRGALQTTEKSPSGAGYTTWADRDANGLKVVIEISGDPKTGYGYSYAQAPWPPANQVYGKEFEMLGPFRTLYPDDRIDDHWWMVRMK